MLIFQGIDNLLNIYANKISYTINVNSKILIKLKIELFKFYYEYFFLYDTDS